MKITNKHTAPITLPAKSRKEAGVRLEPDQTGDADDSLPLIKAWLASGLIVASAPVAPAAAPSSSAPGADDASTPDEKRSRKS
jgi:hypothetical protein